MANIATQALSAGSAVASGVGIGIMYFLFASPLLFGAGFVLFMKQYRNTITLRYKTKGGTDKVIVTKFKIHKKKGEPEAIKTLKKRLIFPIPPDSAVDIMANGAMYVEAYVTETGEATYINVEAKSKKIVEEVEQSVPLPNGKKHKIRTKVQREIMDEISLTRLTTQDKAFYYQQMQKANEKYAINGFWDFLSRNAGIIGLVMLVFVMFLFWGDIMEPAIQAKEIDKQRMDLELKIVDKLDTIINQRQTIPDAPSLNTSSPEFRGPE